MEKTETFVNLRWTGRKHKTTAAKDQQIIRKFKSRPGLTPKAAALEWNSHSDGYLSERRWR